MRKLEIYISICRVQSVYFIYTGQWICIIYIHISIHSKGFIFVEILINHILIFKIPVSWSHNLKFLFPEFLSLKFWDPGPQLEVPVSWSLVLSTGFLVPSLKFQVPRSSLDYWVLSPQCSKYWVPGPQFQVPRFSLEYWVPSPQCLKYWVPGPLFKFMGSWSLV